MHRATCSAVPMMAARAPPPLSVDSMLAWSEVHQPAAKMTWAPLLITVQSSQISGTSATANDPHTSVVAIPFLTVRPALSLVKALGPGVRLGFAVIVVIGSPSCG